MNLLKTYTRPLAVLMLALLALVLLPRELWHEHEETRQNFQQESGLSYASHDDDCALCDFQLPPYEQQLAGLPSLAGPFPSCFVLLPEFTHHSAPLRGYAGRAPPTVKA